MASDDTVDFGETATRLAVSALRARLRHEHPDPKLLLQQAVGDSHAASDALRERGSCFVTLTRQSQLRGCIGSLLPVRRLYEDIVFNTRKAAEDPRLEAVTAADWPELEVSVSVVGPASAVEVDSLEDLHATLRPGVDGLTIKKGPRRATFLPSVWKSMPSPEAFTAALLRKGGWDTEVWPTGATAERYGTDNYTSTPPRPALEDT